MHKNSRGSIAFILIVVLLVVGTVFYLFYIKKADKWYTNNISPTSQTSTPKSEQVDTSDWKTYTNANHGYSFKYPPNWYWEANSQFDDGNHIAFFENETEPDFGYGDHTGNEVFDVSVSSDERSLDEIKNNFYPTAKKTSVNSKPAIKTSFGLYIVKPNSELILHIITGREKAKPFTDQILSTFKFTLTNTPTTPSISSTNEPIPIDDWKTYTNTESGFEFAFPQNWKIRDITSRNYEQVQEYLLLDVTVVSEDIVSETVLSKGTQLRLSVYDNSSANVSPVYPIGKYPTPHPESGEGLLISEKEVNIGTQTAIQREFKNILGYKQNYTHTFLSISKKNNNFVLACHTPDKNKSQCLQILSTFEFVDQ